VNSRDSNSGMNLFRRMIAPHAGAKSFFRDVAISGSHQASLAAVAQDRADVASIDSVTFGLLKRERPELIEAVRVIATSPRSPGLPFIISNTLAPEYLDALRAALGDLIADPSLSRARRTLGLVGARILSPEHYARIREIERAAIDAGYPTMT
jgi:ABC-type phosphate/phosphonate transport system substrate-binding protein